MFKQFIAALFAFVAFSAFAVEVNTATQAEIEAVKGIGPVISTLIINERKKSPFKDWEDMVVRVKGVGEGSAAKFSTDGLTVNGSAYKGAPAAAKTTKVAKTDEPKSGAAKAVDSTESGAKKAASATATGVKKAASATEGGVEKAAKATKTKAGDIKDSAVAKKDEMKEERAEKKAAKKAAKAEKAASATK